VFQNPKEGEDQDAVYYTFRGLRVQQKYGKINVLGPEKYKDKGLSALDFVEKYAASNQREISSNYGAFVAIPVYKRKKRRAKMIGA
jgi:hypothetical protein